MEAGYDEVLDSLLIFAKQPNERVKGSATVSNIVLDITEDGKVAGLEIRKATEFFKHTGIDQSPSNIQNATFNVNYRSDGLVILVQLKFKDEEQKVPIFISSEQPLFATA